MTATDWARSRRLALRELTPADHQAVLEMHRDPRLRAFLLDEYRLDDSPFVRLFLDRIGAFYRRHEGLGIWHATWLGAPPQFAGWFNLTPIAGRPGEVEIGSRLRPEVWGASLALEGGEMLLDHAFDDLGLERVWGICHPGNRSAKVVLLALGFESAGDLPHGGHPASHYQIGMNAWRRLRNTASGTRLRRALRLLARPGRSDRPAIDSLEELPA